jgi:hypothetical protein
VPHPSEQSAAESKNLLFEIRCGKGGKRTLAISARRNQSVTMLFCSVTAEAAGSSSVIPYGLKNRFSVPVAGNSNRAGPSVCSPWQAIP